MHLAIDETEKTSRTFVRAIFEYPFLQAGLTQVFALVMEDNVQALKVDAKTGFTEVNRFDNAGMKGQALILFRMTRNECRWINGKRQRTPAPGLRSSSGGDVGRLAAGSNSADLREQTQRHDALGLAELGTQYRH
jgi:hypothetical protein